MNPELLKLGLFGLLAWGAYQVLGKKKPSAMPATIVPTYKPPTAPVPQVVRPPVVQAPSDSSIASIQMALNNAGASPQLSVDGVSGPKTTAAIKQFQAAHGIDTDGVVGPITLAALGLGPAPAVAPAPAPPPAPTPDVMTHVAKPIPSGDTTFVSPHPTWAEGPTETLTFTGDDDT